MSPDTLRVKRPWPITAVRAFLAAGVLSMAGAGALSAYVGASYIQIPGISGGWQGEQYTDWIKIDAHYWQGETDMRRGFGRRNDSSFFSVPAAPHEGRGELVIALDKRNPILPTLMATCVDKTVIPEVTYAESSDRARGGFQWGPRPAEIPEHFEYTLTDVRFAECPVVPDAPEQAIVVSFADVEWLNYDGEGDGVDFDLEPATLGPAQASGATKAFVVTWFAPAHDVSDDQCPVLNGKPPQEAYFTYLSEEEEAQERAEVAKQGGVNYENGQMSLRGPKRLSVALLPGIVPDPVNAAPQTTMARGINLDGDDGTGEPPAAVRKHKNYVSEDGRTGIDNQLYAVQGCIPGWQGHKGFIHEFANNAMRDGQYSMLIDISGIDDEQNDDSVELTWRYSEDPMVKNGAGTQILSDYTFRVTDDPEYSHYFSRTPGRIVDGVVITDPIDSFQLVLGVYGSPMELQLSAARIRLELKPDGTVKGVLGGYRDVLSAYSGASTIEQYFGFQAPAQYNALKREADGLMDPVTGEWTGISTAYDIEGVPAFVGPPKEQQTAQTEPEGEKAP